MIYCVIEFNSTAKSNNNNNNSKLKKQIAREVGVALAGTYIGEQNARLAYKMGTKTVKMVKKVKKKSVKRTPAVDSMLRYKLYSQPTTTGLVLSDPARLYLRSFLEPFSEDVKSVGCPRPGSMPSYKVTGFLRGVAAIGQAGFGYVALSPTLCNNKFALMYSTSVFAGTLVSQLPNDALYGASAFSPAAASFGNLPFTYDQLTTEVTSTNASSAVEGRIVSSSLRVYYTGTTLNQSGQYYAYADPNLESVLGAPHNSTTAQATGYSAADLGAKEACEIKGADRSGISVVCIPNNVNVMDYPNNGSGSLRKVFPFSNGLLQGSTPANLGCSPMVICVTGVKEQTFYFEAVIHAEYIGPGVPQALLTQSFSDTVGFDSVQMILNRAQRRCATDARKSLRQCILAEAASEGVRV